jgi:hypothetical protein
VLTAVVLSPREEMFTVTRAQALEQARQALTARGVSLGPRWRFLPLADNGAGAPHEFVSRTAGEARRLELVGSYLPASRWRVRIATFEGDLAERAEEWVALVDRGGAVQQLVHTLPEERAGASLDESAAREIARGVLKARLGLDATAGKAREVSAKPSKLKARTDWTFTFADTAIPPLPQGEPRIDVNIAGDEITNLRRYVFVPEEWNRQERAAGTRSTIARIFAGVLFGGLLLAAAVLGVIVWSRGRYAPRVFLLGTALMLAASLVNAFNGYPAMLAQLSTAQPLPLQLGALAGVGLVGLALVSALVGLALGAVPRRLIEMGRLPDREAIVLGISGGFIVAAVSAAATWLRTPPWARNADITPLHTVIPFVEVATDPITGFLTRLAVMLAMFTAIDRMTTGWTRLRIPAAVGLALAGFAAAGPPTGGAVSGWLLSGALTGAALVIVYVLLVRMDLSMTALTLGAAAALGALAQGAHRPFPGALAASLVAAILMAGLAYLWFKTLRKDPTRRSKEDTSRYGTAEPGL